MKRHFIFMNKIQERAAERFQQQIEPGGGEISGTL
jgi:hypothetical protein